MNTCRYLLTSISEENEGSPFLKKFFCAVGLVGLMGLMVLPGILLVALLVGAEEGVDVSCE